MITQTKHASWGISTYEQEHKLYLSGHTSRVIDSLTGNEITRFKAIASIHPAISPSGRYLALPNTYDGIQVLETTDSYQTAYKFNPCKPSLYEETMIPSCAWYRSTDLLVFSTKKRIYSLDLEHRNGVTVLFDLDDFDKRENTQNIDSIAFISSFDIVEDKVFAICYFGSGFCYIVSVDLFTGNSQTVQNYDQANCPNIILCDKRKGFFLLRYGINLAHHIDYQNLTNERMIDVRGTQIAVSNDGTVFAVNIDPFESVIQLFETNEYRKLAEIDYGTSSISSIVFSDKGCFLFLSGRKTIIIDCSSVQPMQRFSPSSPTRILR